MGGLSRIGENRRPSGGTNVPTHPMTTPSRLRQRVQYARASDDVRLAWAESGSGPVVVKAANWLTHLEYEWESPVWRHWIRFFSEHFRYCLLYTSPSPRDRQKSRM